MIRSLRRAGRLVPFLLWLLLPFIWYAMQARWAQP
jgi:hypothetical protein